MNAASRSSPASSVKIGGSAIARSGVVFGSSPAATTSRTSVFRVTTPMSVPSSQTNTARRSASFSRSPAAWALSPASSVTGFETIASRTRATLREDPTGLERAGDLPDRRHHRGVPERQLLLLGELPDTIERVAHLLREPRADLVAVPEQAPEILHPLEVGDGDAAGIREDVRQHRDAALVQDPVGLVRHRAVRALGDQARLHPRRVVGADL